MQLPLIGGRSARPPRQEPRDWMIYAVPLVLLTIAGLIAIALYSWSAKSSLVVFSSSLLIAGASWVFGAFLGFLFGIPRSRTAEGVPRGQFSSNTNLEQISDWLTKILVGLGLVSFGRLIDQVAALASYLAPAVGGDPNGSRYALGLMTLLVPTGFLMGYIGTRGFIAETFARAEKNLADVATAAQLADQVDRAMREQASEADVEEAPAPVDLVITGADSTTVLTTTRAAVTSVVLDAHEVVYGVREADPHAAAQRLLEDGYIDAALFRLADRLLALGSDRTELPPQEIASVVDSGRIFTRSFGRVVAIAFEAKVGEALARLPGVEAEHRPVQYELDGGRPDFVVKSSGNPLAVVEAYCPRHRQSPGLDKLIRERRPFIETTGASHLLIVVPDGVAVTRDRSPDRRVIVVTLKEVAAARSFEALLRPGG